MVVVGCGSDEADGQNDVVELAVSYSNPKSRPRNDYTMILPGLRNDDGVSIVDIRSEASSMNSNREL